MRQSNNETVTPNKQNVTLTLRIFQYPGYTRLVQHPCGHVPIVDGYGSDAWNAQSHEHLLHGTDCYDALHAQRRCDLMEVCKVLMRHPSVEKR